MKRQVVIGTGNKDKLKELQRLLKGSGIKVHPISDFGEVPEVIEDGRTFLANACKKAKEFSLMSDFLTLADDSGLCVNALNGAPGVYSARYAGEDCTYQDNNRKLLKALNGKPPAKRKAKFVSVIALYHKGKKITSLRGECKGLIADSISGGEGFGYDPVFIPEGKTQTFAQMSAKTKNSLSHRGRALQQVKEFLNGYFH